VILHPARSAHLAIETDGECNLRSISPVSGGTCLFDLDINVLEEFRLRARVPLQKRQRIDPVTQSLQKEMQVTLTLIHYLGLLQGGLQDRTRVMDSLLLLAAAQL
jgi:hypothetical protein